MIDNFFYALPFFVLVGIGIYVWYIFHRQAISNEVVQAWAMEHQLTSVSSNDPDASPYFRLVGYDDPIVFRGQWDGRTITAGFGIANFHNDDTIQPVPLFFLQCRLPYPIPGEALIRPPGVQWLGKLQYTALESTMFRGYNSVWTNPKNLSTQIASPDFMDWYQQQRPRPAIYVQGDRCCVLFQRFANAQELDRVTSQFGPILHFLERSAALEKKIV